MKPRFFCLNLVFQTHLYAQIGQMMVNLFQQMFPSTTEVRPLQSYVAHLRTFSFALYKYNHYYYYYCCYYVTLILDHFNLESYDHVDSDWWPNFTTEMSDDQCDVISNQKIVPTNDNKNFKFCLKIVKIGENYLLLFLLLFFHFYCVCVCVCVLFLPYWRINIFINA